MAISLWTTRIVCMWLSDGTCFDMKTEPWHCYIANFIGVRHQVLHAADGAEAGRGYTKSSVLGDIEVVYFARSAFFRFSSAPTNVGFGRASRPACALALARHSPSGPPTAKLILPSLEEVERRGALREARVPKKRHRAKSKG